MIAHRSCASLPCASRPKPQAHGVRSLNFLALLAMRDAQLLHDGATDFFRCVSRQQRAEESCSFVLVEVAYVDDAFPAPGVDVDQRRNVGFCPRTFLPGMARPLLIGVGSGVGWPPAAITAPTRSTAARCGSLNKCAYLAVVVGEA